MLTRENNMEMAETSDIDLSFEDFKNEVLNDYKTAHLSRQMSLIARKEVLTGKAKFGIFGDGKEVAQIAMAKQFRNGDWRSGYYRDQTFMLAAGMTTPQQFFALLYGETNTELNPDNGGRSFNNHYATRFIDEDGNWRNQMEGGNTASDISPTAGQMPRSVGLALASKVYRNNEQLHQFTQFSDKGNEVVFVTIGDGSTSEGHFFETMNAAGVLQVPMAVSVWDDGYAISVPTEKQTIKGNISKALQGFEKGARDSSGILIYRAKGWDYPGLCQMYEEGIARCRAEHVPVLFHVEELTQPMGHSTSGSHERYKSEERMKWERENDCLIRMREWIVETGLAIDAELDKIEVEALKEIKEIRNEVFNKYMQPLVRERDELVHLVTSKHCVCNLARQSQIDDAMHQLQTAHTLNRKEILSAARKVLRNVCSNCDIPGGLKNELKLWVVDYRKMGHEKYNAYLYDESSHSALKVEPVAPFYSAEPEKIHGREVLLQNFDAMLSRDPRLMIFGEDTGKLGGVNQTLEGMQEKYSENRVFDTGIRETTIIGKGIGLALRGLRPIAEIQYFDYLLYALQTLSDDAATLHYRTKGGQKVPLIISTRGHRLEGPWHAGSPMSMVINSIRGIYVCVPRDMTRAAGFYNTLLQGDDPALVIEPLNGYRLRELRPENPGEFRIPLGIPEVLKEGRDVTLVTYGSCVRIGMEASRQLEEIGISVELIDVQTLLPFDIHHVILESVKKTNRVVFFDEDVPGGATAYMMQKVVEEQGGFFHLDAPPVTVSAKDHRPAYGTDGDYFSKPNAEDVYEAIYALMNDANPGKFPPIYS
ncbi:alpha-ketoacid dehydrogenase subunit alpha/beta [Alkalitalea saponilacus]|uniref:3-methyl-2-oxobutanoate dehydrogenase (2-methylpropanoyl-transferring) n=1 Tax=Alkalitalea saponilacus TaxID=889453 RepID=A0A1T5C8Q4_9BACT|nr:alpha-ketoacid dehydrogenase subunit alpha/beta [Alkalitalea saponilacus]SKB55805.1 Pyruvate/2-oxoglutarate/acetoin dehydrogenase complex, dehydrogenase (E1) component [Alkalitalea saponilacus]